MIAPSTSTVRLRPPIRFPHSRQPPFRPPFSTPVRPVRTMPFLDAEPDYTDPRRREEAVLMTLEELHFDVASRNMCLKYYGKLASNPAYARVRRSEWANTRLESLGQCDFSHSDRLLLLMMLPAHAVIRNKSAVVKLKDVNAVEHIVRRLRACRASRSSSTSAALASDSAPECLSDGSTESEDEPEPTPAPSASVPALAPVHHSRADGVLKLCFDDVYSTPTRLVTGRGRAE